MTKSNRGSNIVAVGAYNERLVLSILRSKGALSKVELTQETGLSKQTLTDVIGRLETNGLLLRGEPVRGRIGQPQVPFLLNPEGAYSIGFKIGRKSYELVLMDFTGQIHKWVRQHIDYPMPDEMVAFVVDGLQAIRSEFPPSIVERCVGMGVAMPNELWRWAEEFDAPEDKIASWRDFDVGAALEAVAGMPVMIANDVAAACNGELIFGKSDKPSDFLYVYIGTFIGGGACPQRQDRRRFKAQCWLHRLDAGCGWSGRSRGAAAVVRRIDDQPGSQSHEGRGGCVAVVGPRK